MAKAVASNETLTVAAIPADGEQVQIDGITYTFRDILAAAYDVQRDGGCLRPHSDRL